MGIYFDGAEYEDQASFEAQTNPNIPEDIKKVYIQTDEPKTPPKEAPEASRSVTDKLLGIGGERYQTWPEKAVRSIIGGLALPGDVAQGNVEPDSIQAIERAADLAGAMVFGPAPIASRAAEGTLGSFMGVKSKTIDKTKLYQAQNMELEGVHPDEIWKATGTFKGADGRWRQEISDQNMTLNRNEFDIENVLATEAEMQGGSKVLNTLKGWESVGGQEADEIWKPKFKNLDINDYDVSTVQGLQKYLDEFNKPEFSYLHEVVNHPELFKAYPELREMRVQQLPQELINRGIKGQVSGNTIYLAPGNPEYLRSVLAHEIQHGIQKIEGFARGGNRLEFESPELKIATESFKKAREGTEKELKAKLGDQEYNTAKLLMWAKEKYPETGIETTPDFKRVVELQTKDPETYDRILNIVKSEVLLEKEAMRHHELYERLAGEVEARNVQSRLDYGSMQRFLENPRMTEDKPRFVQEVKGQTEAIQPRMESSEPPVSMRRAANDNSLTKEELEQLEDELMMLRRQKERPPITEKQQEDWMKEVQRILDEEKKVPGQFEPASPRWPNNENPRPLNEQEQWFKDYDALHALGESLGTPVKNNKLGVTKKWSELDYAKYNKAGREFAKKYGQVWEDVKPLD